MNTKSIRFRLTFWYSTALIISIGVIFASFYIITRQELYRHTDIILTSHARQVAVSVQKQLEKGDVSSYDPLLYNEFGAIPGMMLVITDGNGTILHSTYPNASINSEINTLFNEIKSDGREKILNQNFPGTSQRMMLIPLKRGNELIGTVMMGHPIDVIQKSLNSLLANLLSLFLLLVFPTIFGGWVLAKRALRPVNEVSEKMQRITSENLTERILSPQTHDEIEILVETFNNLLTRIEAAFTRERQFIGDVAHELKTPLATQRSTIEVLLSQKRTNEEYRKATGELLVDNQKLADTVADVLDLAWAEADRTQTNVDTINLTDLMEEIYEIASKLSSAKKINIYKHFTKNILVIGKKDKVFRALLNIVDNAVKYTAKGTISLILTTNNSTATIKIKDTGVGITDEDLPHIFMRFYRGSKSGNARGTGLGLSIAKSIINSYHGNISVQSSSRGSTFTVTLPVFIKEGNFPIH